MTIMEKLGISSDKWANYKEDDFDQISWTGEPQCTKEEWEIAKAKLQAEYDAKQYQRDRQYPDLGEQFDLLFKDINEGTLDKTGGFYTAIKAVKDAHPKPSE